MLVGAPAVAQSQHGYLRGVGGFDSSPTALGCAVPGFDFGRIYAAFGIGGNGVRLLYISRPLVPFVPMT